MRTIPRRDLLKLRMDAIVDCIALSESLARASTDKRMEDVFRHWIGAIGWVMKEDNLHDEYDAAVDRINARDGVAENEEE